MLPFEAVCCIMIINQQNKQCIGLTPSHINGEFLKQSAHGQSSLEKPWTTTKIVSVNIDSMSRLMNNMTTP